MSTSEKFNDRPLASDSFQETIAESSLFTNSLAGIMLENTVQAMTAFGQEAEEQFQINLKELQGLPQEVIIELAAALSNKCEQDDYPTKFGLVYLATQLKHVAALPFFKRLIFTPIPQERSKQPSLFSTVAEETILRTTAVEGLGYFAEKGSAEAKEALLRCLEIPSISLQRAAIQTLKTAKQFDRQTKKQVLEILPERHRFLIDLKTPHVKDVEQIKKPERHLKPLPKGVKRKDKDPAPRFDSDDQKKGNSPNKNK